MRYLKLYESFREVKTESQIRSICIKYGITNYTINDDGSIDGNGNVSIQGNKLKELPIKFRHVKGDFHCHNNKLTTLEGCPESVGGGFYCHVNKLTSLYGIPKSIGTDFVCFDNELTSLEGCPKSIFGFFKCNNNNIRTFDGFPHKVIDRDGRTNITCSYNPIYQLWKLFQDETKIDLFDDFGITDGETVLVDRLNEFLEMIGKPPVIKGYKCK